MNNLEYVTFIIPTFIESSDRLSNAKSTLGYLNKWFKTNVIIHELIDDFSRLDFINDLKNLNIIHLTEKRNGMNYHRTRQLNEMLNLVKTPICVNYDIDVILPIDSYIKSQDMILNQNIDVVYPYGEGTWQKRVYQNFDRTEFNNSFEYKLIDKNFDLWSACVGHCFFIKTDLYKKCGGENENFIAYGPEDVERYERFSKLQFSLQRIDDYIIHFEHYRTPFSHEGNVDFNKNQKIYEYLSKMSKLELVEYYKVVDYLEKYNFQ